MTGGIDFTQLFTSVKDTIISAITSVVPIGLAIFGTIWAVKKGVGLLRNLGR